MLVHFQNVSLQPTNNGTLKYFKCIETSKEERIQSVLLKPDCPLACLDLLLTLLSSATETSNSKCHIQNEMKLGRWVSMYVCMHLQIRSLMVRHRQQRVKKLPLCSKHMSKKPFSAGIIISMATRMTQIAIPVQSRVYWGCCFLLPPWPRDLLPES